VTSHSLTLMAVFRNDDLAKIGSRWNEARQRERALAAQLYAAIVEAVESGMSEVQAAKVAGVDRMTVRRALGKR
jgi:DNA invertase Pin-like site-specific DNA recombinase